MNEKIKYKEAIKKIETLVTQIESEDPDVDNLSDMVKEALELLQYCKKHLKKTEDDLNQALQDLE